MGSAPSPGLELTARCCPVCGSTDDSAVAAESNFDPERLDEFAFASRKAPELMHHRLVLCPVCDLVYATPAPASASLAHAYEDAAYDSAQESRYAAATYAGLVRRLLPELPGERLVGPGASGGGGGALDIGTGDGAFLGELLELGFEHVVGVEPSTAPLEASDPRVRDRIVHGTFDAARFEPGRFRLVTSFQTLEHVPEPLELCRGAARLLCPGGALLLVCHDRRSAINRMMGRRSPIFDLEHLQLFSARSLTELLARAGLQLREPEPIANRYPLRYWLRLAPLPGGSRAVAVADRLGIGARPVSLRAGNLAATGFRPEEGGADLAA